MSLNPLGTIKDTLDQTTEVLNSAIELGQTVLKPFDKEGDIK